jgi:hypothetical protein
MIYCPFRSFASFDHNKNINERFYTADRETNSPISVAAVILKTKQKSLQVSVKVFPFESHSQIFELSKVFEDSLAAFVMFFLHYTEKTRTYIIR